MYWASGSELRWKNILDMDFRPNDRRRSWGNGKDCVEVKSKGKAYLCMYMGPDDRLHPLD